MYSQLGQSNIKNLLYAKGVQQASGRVCSTFLLEEMSLIGFIPHGVCYNDVGYMHYKIAQGLNLNGNLIVTPNLVRFEDGEPVPVFKSIRKINGEKYKISERFLIDTIYEERKDREKETISLWKGKELLKKSREGKLCKLSIKQDVFEIGEDGNLYYTAQGDELELSHCYNETICISSDFLCLCTYMNKVTGLPSYTVLSSEETIRVLPPQEDV